MFDLDKNLLLVESGRRVSVKGRSVVVTRFNLKELDERVAKLGK